MTCVCVMMVILEQIGQVHNTAAGCAVQLCIKNVPIQVVQKTILQAEPAAVQVPLLPVPAHKH